MHYVNGNKKVINDMKYSIAILKKKKYTPQAKKVIQSLRHNTELNEYEYHTIKIVQKCIKIQKSRSKVNAATKYGSFSKTDFINIWRILFGSRNLISLFSTLLIHL